MRNTWIVGCLLLVGMGIAVSATPLVVVDESDFDFGSVGQGYMVKHTFELRNAGDQVLEIYRVYASCGCTATALSVNQLQPGASVPLEVKVIGDHVGSKQVTVSVYTNAPDQFGQPNDDRSEPDVKLYMRGVVSPAQESYEIAPSALANDLTLLVDVRDAVAYAANHLLGAINLPADGIAGTMNSLPRGVLIVAYDQSGEAADRAVQTLVAGGYYSSYYLQGGLSRWVATHDDRFLVYASPLPSASGSTTGGVSGRPYDQGTLNSKFYVLIDLRDAAAYSAGHIPGAINVPRAQLSQWYDRIPREARIIVYDQDETNSLAAYQNLLGARFTRPSVLLGGLDEWIYQYGDDLVTQL